MAELAELALSSDLQVVERIVQRRASFDPRTLMGSGKLQDLIIHALRLQADFIIVDQNLTPAQARAIVWGLPMIVFALLAAIAQR